MTYLVAEAFCILYVVIVSSYRGLSFSSGRKKAVELRLINILPPFLDGEILEKSFFLPTRFFFDILA
jgi:hypothetical protein